MAKKTLLDIVQDILNDADSDSVNSIDDTVEAQQVAQIVKTAFEEIISNRPEWPHLFEIGQLDASGDTNKPNYMHMPDAISKLSFIKYNKRTSTSTKDAYDVVYYKDPREFVELVNARDSSASDVTQVSDDTGIVLNILNDSNPSYWTSFDDEWIIFDAHYSDLDATLQKSKTQVGWYREPTFSLTDDHTPELPSKLFPYLQAEAKSKAFNTLFQSPNAKEEQISRRQRSRMTREAWRTNGGLKTNNYGRK